MHDESEGPTRHPLWWPPGQARTPVHEREPSRFRVTDATARDSLIDELHRLPGADLSNLVVSTNVALRLDGMPRANQRRPDDPGVAVFFRLDGQPMALACDRYHHVAENMRALAKHIEATRGIARWGCGTLRQAFAGYRMLTYGDGKVQRPWREILGGCSTRREVRDAYHRLARGAHPDQGGSAEAFQELQQARDDALQEVGDD